MMSARPFRFMDRHGQGALGRANGRQLWKCSQWHFQSVSGMSVALTPSQGRLELASLKLES